MFPLWVRTVIMMVEAGRIELPSENPFTSGATGVVCDFSPAQLVHRQPNHAAAAYGVPGLCGACPVHVHRVNDAFCPIPRSDRKDGCGT